MSLLQEIERYAPVNEQEKWDQEMMVQYMLQHSNYLDRSNVVAHFTTVPWTLNAAHTKTLMVYHNIYDSWSWIGGHADGVEDLCAVAMRELQEETGVCHSRLLSREIASIEVLTVFGHMKRGAYVSSHLHFNVSYLAEADENDPLIVNEAENKAVQWWPVEEVLKQSRESWLVEHIYPKLLRRS